MYPFRYMRRSLDTEARNRCADRRAQCLTSLSTRVSMWEPKAGGAPPERNPLNRQHTRRKESDHEESTDWWQSQLRSRWPAATALIAAGQQTATLAGTAKDEAKKPYADYTVRARDVCDRHDRRQRAARHGGQLLAAGSLELEVSRRTCRTQEQQDKVVCTEGPFDLTQQMLKNDVVIDCDKVPAAWWLLGAAAAAGITAGIVASNSSPSQ